MAATSFTFTTGAELPGLTLPWQEETAPRVWTDLDLSTGYTFTLLLVRPSGTIALTKTTGIFGAVGSVIVGWATDELDIPAGSYVLKLRARETGTGKDRDYRPGSPIRITITT